MVVACAGSGKTTRLVEDALADPAKRIAMVTYTNSNAREIVSKFNRLNSGVPGHAHIMTWFGFLLRECARPYQREMYSERRIATLAFTNKRSTQGVPASNVKRFYFAEAGRIFSDKVAQFAAECESASSGAVTSRLADAYTDIFIDEFQDLAGWDLEVVEMLLRSDIRVTMVGDPRQFIYATNPSAKNKQYRGARIVDLVKKWKTEDLCIVDRMNESHRCSKAVCEFANGLWPGMDGMTPSHQNSDKHSGVFLVSKGHVSEYVASFWPQVLRHSRRTRTPGCEALNFGQAKGLQFDRVLIFPTGPIRTFLATGDLEAVEKGKSRLHVAVTRARHSVAFVLDGNSAVVENRWKPEAA